MPSITTWNRLEPRTRTTETTPGDAACVHDPLWLLARQWQVGEFQGEDGGSPILARWRARTAAVTRFHPGVPAPGSEQSGTRFDARATPLETLVERRPASLPAADEPGPNGLRRAVESGQRFLRMLALAPTSGDYRAAFLEAYVVRPLGSEQRAALDAPSRAYLDLVTGRALDGRRLRAALAPEAGSFQLDPSIDIRSADLAEVEKVCRTWLAWSDDLVSGPDASSARAWQPERLEYAFSLGASLGTAARDERTLCAEQFGGGPLDWDNFDLAEDVTIGAADDAAAGVITRTIIPTPVSCPGLPAARFWEFEDAILDLGALQPGSTDISQILAIDVLSGHGNDWFVIPIEIPVGALVETRSLVVTDTFGVRTLLRPNGATSSGGRAPWSMFGLSKRVPPTATGGASAANLFFLPPNVGKPIDSEPIEELILVRDEMANVAWAIERRLESPLGMGVDTATEASATPPEKPLAPRETPLYRIASAVPRSWIPLLPVRVSAASAEVRLARASLLDIDGGRRIVGSRTRLLSDPRDPDARLLIHEEEVPREGAIVRSRYRAGRGPDGELHVWLGNRKTVGRGERSSGLRFDWLDI